MGAAVRASRPSLPPAPSLLADATDLAGVERRVKALAEQRPAVYRMLDPSGRVLYVGKAKRLRARLLAYFQARFPQDKGARILHAAGDIAWDYQPSEFAAHLTELHEIQKWRPPYNVHMNQRRNTLFIRVSNDSAPKLSTTAKPAPDGGRYYGPLTSPMRAAEAIRVLNDLLGLRDCAQRMPMVFAEQGDLFGAPRRAGCPRHDLGLCSGPCAGLVTAAAYHERVESAVAFLEGRAIAPVDRIVAEMTEWAARAEFEVAARWRQRFEALEWLLGATTRARAAIELLTFVYHQPGTHGDDRAYLVRRGVVRAGYPWPATPIEREAFRAVVRADLEAATPEAASQGPLPPPSETIEEMLLVMSWFRRHPEALRRTSRIEDWM